MNDEIHEIIKDIKSKFRLFMNGPVSQSMREKGMDYKVNFGIEYPRLKEIAAGYEKNHEVAQELWKDNIRECKILAGLLQPVDTFCPEIAEIWIEGMHLPELAEYTVMNLFQYLPYASDVVFRWIADEREYFQVCGFLLMARLLMKELKLNERAEAEFLDQAFTALEGDDGNIQRAASVALRKFGLQSRDTKRLLSRQLVILGKSDKPSVRALTEEIKNDINF